MKIRTLIQSTLVLSIALGAMMLTGCGEEQPATPSAKATTATKAPVQKASLTAADDQRLIVVTVEGIHCGGCANTIANAVKKLPGAVDATVSVEDGKASLLVDKDSTTDTQALIATINQLAGGTLYKATAVK